MINTLLPAACVGLCLYNRDPSVLIFASVTFIFCLIGKAIPDSQGFSYYFLAAFSDLIVIAWVSRLKNISDTAIYLQRVCIGFLVVNFIGWVLYMLYVSPRTYNDMSSILFLFATLFILRKNGGGPGVRIDRSFPMGDRLNSLPRYYPKGRSYVSVYGGKT